MVKNYIKTLRQKVGHEPIILNFAGGILVNDLNFPHAESFVLL